MTGEVILHIADTNGEIVETAFPLHKEASYFPKALMDGALFSFVGPAGHFQETDSRKDAEAIVADWSGSWIKPSYHLRKGKWFLTYIVVEPSSNSWIGHPQKAQETPTKRLEDAKNRFEPLALELAESRLATGEDPRWVVGIDNQKVYLRTKVGNFDALVALAKKLIKEKKIRKAQIVRWEIYSRNREVDKILALYVQEVDVMPSNPDCDHPGKRSDFTSSRKKVSMSQT